jgi:hypothetical protein
VNGLPGTECMSRKVSVETMKMTGIVHRIRRTMNWNIGNSLL